MKKIALAAALSLAATSSYAGARGGKTADPVVEPEVIAQQTRGTAAGIVVPVLLLIALAAVVASR